MTDVLSKSAVSWNGEVLFETDQALLTFVYIFFHTGHR
jgi:hypothetical protein